MGFIRYLGRPITRKNSFFLVFKLELWTMILKQSFLYVV